MAFTNTMPLEITIGITLLMIGLGIYGLLVSHHPKWKRELYWGRRKQGPKMSIWSATGVSLMFLGAAFILPQEGYPFTMPSWPGLIFRTLTTLGCVMMFTGLIYDWLRELSSKR